MISEKTFSYVNLLLKWCRTVKPALFILVPTARTNWIENIFQKIVSFSDFILTFVGRMQVCSSFVVYQF